MTTLECLLETMKLKNSLVCVGLDPDLNKMPEKVPEIWGSGDSLVLNFLRRIVNITAPHCCAFKIQKAFFDCYPNGHKLISSLIDYIHISHPEIPVFIDCKVGDIDNTMKAYLENIFDNLKADGVVVNPYMGNDVFSSLANYPRKVGLVLVKTSNPGAKIIQEYRGLWKHILGLVVTRWNVAQNLIPIISSASLAETRWIRSIVPQNMPILFAGYGAQGIAIKHLDKLANEDNSGVFVNSSREILYPYSSSCSSWEKRVLLSVVTMKEKLNELRRIK